MLGAATAVQSFPLGDGDVGVEQTVRTMVHLIDRGKKSSAVREQVALILGEYNVPAFDFTGEYRAIFDWAMRNVRWTRDPSNKEALHTPDWILKYRIGDCDDFSILICSLLGSVGARTRLVTISNHPDAPDEFSHIYPEVQLDDTWVAVDAGRKNPAFGKAPRSYFRKRIWDCDTGDYTDDVFGVGATVMRGRGMRGLRGRLGFNTPFFRASERGRAVQPNLRGPRSMNGLGQWDWSTFEQQIPSLIATSTTGAANIVRAANAPQVAAASSGLINPYTGQSVYGTTPYATTPFGTIDPTTLLLFGGLAVVALMMSREG